MPKPSLRPKTSIGYNTLASSMLDYIVSMSKLVNVAFGKHRWQLNCVLLLKIARSSHLALQISSGILKSGRLLETL